MSATVWNGGAVVNVIATATALTIAALRGIDKTKYSFYFVAGYYAVGDGGGGWYYYDSSDTTSTDNSGTIIVASDGGRWKYLFAKRGILDVSIFGAGLHYDGVTSDVAAIQAADTYAYNGGSSYQRTVYYPARTYVIDSVITMHSSILGDGPYTNGVGTIFKWTGAGSKVFDFPLYVQGWIFKYFTIDTTAVTTAVSMMYFDAGLHGASFEDVTFKGSWSGSNFGGTYHNHDGIVIVGSVGGVKVDMSQNCFKHLVWQRCRRGLTITDDIGNGGPGNGCVFDGCFSFCNGWTIKLFGANNVFNGCEFNAEAGNHIFEMAGGYAVAWKFNSLDVQSGSNTTNDAIVHADTSGGAALFSWDCGTLEQAGDASGYPPIVLDAGSGSHKYRYHTWGVNNLSGNQITTDIIQTATLGVFTTPSFDATNFTASGAMTATVGGGAVTTYEYEIVNKRMTVIFQLGDFTLGGVADLAFKIKVPGGFTCAKQSSSLSVGVKNNNVNVTTPGLATIGAGGTNINIYLDNSASNNWTLSSHTAVQGSITFEVQ